MQTLVIWSASGRTVGVTLSSILTCSRTSCGSLFNNAELMVLSCGQTEKKNHSRDQNLQQNCTRGPTAEVHISQTCLVQLSAKALKNVMFVDFENWFAFVKDGMHDHAKRVHVRGRVTADGQDVLRGQVLRVGEAEGRQVGIPLFTCVLRLRSTRGQWNTHSWRFIWSSKTASPTHLSIWRVCGWDAEVKAHNLPGAALVEDNVFGTQVPMDHFHATVEERQALRDLKTTQNRAFSIKCKHGTGVNVLLKPDNRDKWWSQQLNKLFTLGILLVQLQTVEMWQPDGSEMS